jgi:hypothetical protein
MKPCLGGSFVWNGPRWNVIFQNLTSGFNQRFWITRVFPTVDLHHNWIQSQRNFHKSSTLGWSFRVSVCIQSQRNSPHGYHTTNNIKTTPASTTHPTWVKPGYMNSTPGMSTPDWYWGTYQPAMAWGTYTYQVIYTYLIPVPIPSVYLPYTKAKISLGPNTRRPDTRYESSMWTVVTSPKNHLYNRQGGLFLFLITAQHREQAYKSECL